MGRESFITSIEQLTMFGPDPVVLEAHGDFNLERFCDQVGINPDFIHEYVEYLPTYFDTWALEIHDPDRLNPHGRLGLSHPVFDDDTAVILSSTEHQHRILYDVSVVRGRDVDSRYGQLDFESALRALIQVATERRHRQSPILPPHEPLERLESFLHTQVSKLV